MPLARFNLPAPGSVTGDFPGTVPTLVAGSIAQTTPTVGTTLTVTGSNEAPAPARTFIWETRPTPGTGGWSAAAGTNNAATYDTTGRPTGEYRRGVSSGQQGPVYTAGVTVSAASGAFSDDFNRANGALGANWVVYQNLGGSPPTPVIDTNEVLLSDASLTGGRLIRTTTSISGAAFAQLTFVSRVNGGNFGVAIVDTAASRAYWFRFTNGSGARELIRREGTTNNVIGSASNASIPNGTVMRIERTVLDANTVRVRVFQGGTQIISVDDTNANRITGDVFGMFFMDMVNVTHSLRIDNFSQGAA